MVDPRSEPLDRTGPQRCYTDRMPCLGFDVSTVHAATLGVILMALGCGDDSAPAGGTTGPTSTTSTTASMDTGALDDTGTGSSGSSDGADSSTGQIFCPQSHRCVPAVAEGWNGPVATLESETDAEEPACGGSYAELGTLAHDGLVAPPATCGCSCEDPEDVTCETSVIMRFWGDDATCTANTPEQLELFTTVCNPLQTQYAANTFWTADPVGVTGGSCNPVSEETIVPARFEKRVTACGGAEILDGCAPDQVCAPRPETPFGEQLCVWREGDHECPMGYEDRRLLFADIMDDRGCAECTCDLPTGLCDDAYVTLLSNPCNPPVSGIVTADGECHGTGSALTRSATFYPGEPTAFCAPSAGAPTGTATGDGPVTLCCR